MFFGAHDAFGTWLSTSGTSSAGAPESFAGFPGFWFCVFLPLSLFSTFVGTGFEMMKKPEVNIRFGCWYLNYLCGLYDGDLNCVISAYHAGPGTVNIWLMNPSVSDDSKTFRLDRLPEGETKTYAERVTRDYGIYKILWNQKTKS